MLIDNIFSDYDIDKAIKNKNAAMKMYGFKPADFARHIFQEHKKGKITEEEAIELIKDYIFYVLDNLK